MLVSAVLFVAGCVYSGTSVNRMVSERMVKGIAIAHSPVGNVVPVYVMIKCDGCEKGHAVPEPYIIREHVYALNSAGQYVPTLPLGEAVGQAGGADKLTPVLTKVTDDQVSKISAEEERKFFASAGIVLGIVGAVAGRHYSQGKWWASAEGRKLMSISLQEDSTLACDPRYVNRNNGWVFFPNGKYRGVRLDVYMLQPGYVKTETELVEQIELRWVEQPGMPQGNFPAVTGIPESCD